MPPSSHIPIFNTFTEARVRHAVDDATCKFTSDPQLLFQHPYPATKIMFMPDREGAQPDLLATTGAPLALYSTRIGGWKQADMDK